MLETDDDLAVTGAQSLAQNVIAYHVNALKSGDRKLRDAVIVKSVALCALAFDIPPTRDETTFDVDEIVVRLKEAIKTIRQFEG